MNIFYQEQNINQVFGQFVKGYGNGKDGPKPEVVSPTIFPPENPEMITKFTRR